MNAIEIINQFSIPLVKVRESYENLKNLWISTQLFFREKARKDIKKLNSEEKIMLRPTLYAQILQKNITKKICFSITDNFCQNNVAVIKDSFQTQASMTIIFSCLCRNKWNIVWKSVILFTIWKIRPNENGQVYLFSKCCVSNCCSCGDVNLKSLKNFAFLIFFLEK